MPAERMTFGAQVVVQAPLRCILYLRSYRLTTLGFETRPVKRKSGGIAKSQELLCTLLGLLLLFPFVFTTRKRDKVKRRGAEEKLMPHLMDHHLLIRQRRAI